MILLGEMKECVVNEGTGPVSQRRLRGVPRVPGQGPAAECRVRALREFCKEAREARTTSSPAGAHLRGGGSTRHFGRPPHRSGGASIQMPSCGWAGEPEVVRESAGCR